MTWQIGLTLAVVVGVFSSLVFAKVSADVVLLGGLTILLAAGVVSVSEGLSGFSNEGMITVAVLYVVAALFLPSENRE